MVEELFNEVYDKFKLNFYKNIFQKFENKDQNLSATEIFCADVIFSLNRPTISQLTNFMGISQPNAAYRISSLVRKGYVKKIQSTKDKREYYLELTDKYYAYNDVKKKYVDLVINRLEEKLSKEDVEKFKYILELMTNELMPEVTEDMKKIKYENKKQ